MTTTSDPIPPRPLRPALRILLLTAVALGAHLGAADEQAVPRWTATTWDGKPAWSGTCGAVTAIVAPAVGRLVSFGPSGGPNLLYVPAGGGIAIGGAVLHGGHQVWLGPQERWVWPPPAAWESAAVDAVAAGAQLTLHLPSDQHVPALTRTYRLDGTGLACGVTWSDAARPWQVMQVFQVASTCRLDPLRITPGAEAPRGFLLQAEDKISEAAVLDEGWRSGPDGLRPARRTVAGKVFLPAQTLRARDRGWLLTLTPGISDGREAGPADHGLTTEVYLTRPDQPYIELEQCSNQLQAAAGAASPAVTVEMRLQAEPER